MIGTPGNGGSARRSLAPLNALAIALPLLIAAIVFFWGVYYVLETTTPTIKSDAWYFVDAWLIPWQDGSFTLADLWAKRHDNHAQPLAAILFLANAHWLGLDFTIETLVALLLAAGFCVALVAIGRRYALHRSTPGDAWLVAAAVCVVFSINATDKLSWSIVGLFFIGHCIGLALILMIARQRAAIRPVRTFVAALVTCVLVDSSGLLWCAAAIALCVIELVRGDIPSRRAPATRILCLLAAIVAYTLGYAWLAPPPDGVPPGPLSTTVASLIADAEQVWKLLLPFGAASAHPGRITQLLGPVHGPALALPLTLLLAGLCLFAHAWMWITSVRVRVNEGFMLACGLAFFAYGTIAGILLQRVPHYGFDYVTQPRYGVFYDFLVLAPMLAWICRPAAATPLRRWLSMPAASFLVLPVLIAPLWFKPGWDELPWIRAWNDDIARDTWQLLEKPGSLPDDCNPFVVICGFPEQVRSRLTQSLVDDNLNLASSSFRLRHALPVAAMEPLGDGEATSP